MCVCWVTNTWDNGPDTLLIIGSMSACQSYLSAFLLPHKLPTNTKYISHKNINYINDIILFLTLAQYQEIFLLEICMVNEDNIMGACGHIVSDNIIEAAIGEGFPLICNELCNTSIIPSIEHLYKHLCPLDIFTNHNNRGFFDICFVDIFSSLFSYCISTFIPKLKIVAENNKLKNLNRFSSFWISSRAAGDRRSHEKDNKWYFFFFSSFHLWMWARWWCMMSHDDTKTWILIGVWPTLVTSRHWVIVDSAAQW